jgi:glycosyltransferase involved in cell wall biosynthesis
LTIHGYFVYESVAGRAREGSFMWSFLQKLESTAYHRAGLTFTVDDEIRRYIEGFGVSSQKIVALRNFVDVDEFSPEGERSHNRERFNLPEDKFLILCPRRLVRKCGVIYAAQAAKGLRERLGKGFVLVYTGEGTERERITRYVEDNDLLGNVVLLGNIPHESMPTLYRAADAVVIPSVTVGVEREATSISALEAMASGVPVVASDIGGLRELISTQENGYLVPERDVHALAEALFRIATEDQTALVDKAREDVVSGYSHIERAKEYLSHYSAAC